MIALDAKTLDQKSKTVSANVPTKFLGSLLVATDDAVYVGGIDKDVLRVDAKTPTTQEEKTFPESPDWLAVSGNTLDGTASPSIGSLLIGADGATFAETSRVSLAYLYGFSKFVFVP